MVCRGSWCLWFTVLEFVVVAEVIHRMASPYTGCLRRKGVHWLRPARERMSTTVMGRYHSDESNP